MIRRMAFAARRRIRAFLNHGIILIYHRVANLASDPQLMAVAPARFEEQMDLLRRYFTPISLSELTNNLNNSKKTKGAVAITFDDGYADSYLEAKPILEKFEIPATIFITTGFIGSARELWWDDLERLILLKQLLPSKMQVEIKGEKLEWNLRSLTENNSAGVQWNVENSEIPSERHRMYRSLVQSMRNLPAQERSEVLSQLAEVAQIPFECRETHRGLKRNELVSLSQSDLIEIGAHTITHPVLSTLDRKQQEEEIGGSKTGLEEIINRPVTSFAYPYGLTSDYNQASIDLVKHHGFQRACSNYPGNLNPKIDLFQLPRFIMRNYSGKEFQEKLHECFTF
jgi:peptidoglycan/xylan/chitin deacetylase (PgdA/CDA1 family)